MIVVTGVTGQLGRIVIEDLLERVPADQLAAVARSPEKAADLAGRGVDVRHGDYADPSTLPAAFAGADRLLFVSSSDVEHGVRVGQHRNVVAAAVEAGVGQLAYTSAIIADKGPLFLAAHQATEAAILDSGLTYTLLRNTFYTEGFVNPGLAAAVDAGELTAPAIGHPLATATIADLAHAASAVLVTDGHENTVHELRGPLWTYAELAEQLSAVAGKQVRYREAPDADAGPLGFLLPILRDPEFGRTTPDLEKLLGRPATPVEDVVRTLFSR
jgi:NAD(P)H dehydrogenase (quinone)